MADPRWYPSKEQMKDPESLERTLRQVLKQHYALVDQVNAAKAPTSETEGEEKGGAGAQGPSNTKLLGLNVEPVDVQTLANGATLKFNKTRGTFSFQ